MHNGRTIKPWLQMSDAEKRLLFAYLVRNNSVCSKAYSVLSPSAFNALEADLAAIWDVTRSWYGRTKKSFSTKDLFWAEFNRMGYGSRLGFSDEDKKTFVKLVNSIFSIKLDESPVVIEEIVSRYLQPFLTDRNVRELMARLAMGGDIDSGFELVRQEMDRTRVTGKEIIDPFSQSEEQLNTAPGAPFATGFALFDDMTHGGVRSRSLIGCLSPTGVGKTTSSVCLAVELAKQCEHSIIFTYETTANPEYRNRIWSNVLNISTDAFDRPFSELDPELKARVLKASEMLSGYIHLVDMTHGPGSTEGVAAVDSMVHDQVSLGRQPRIVIIDWLGDMANKYAATANRAGDMPSVLPEIMSGLKEVASKYDTCIFVTHQTNTLAGKRGLGGAVATGYEARGTGQFSDWCSFSFAFGAKDKNGVVKVQKTKGRGGDSRVIRWAKIHGDQANIELLDQVYAVDYTHDTDEPYWAEQR